VPETVDACELIADLQNNPVCSVLFDADVPCLTVIWKRQASALNYVACMSD
jgi:hypothetical protein